MPDPTPLRVGLDPSLGPWAPEVKYALRVLLRIAGCPCEFAWASAGDAGRAWDLYYGPRRENAATPVSITACGRPFGDAPWLELRRVHDERGLPFLEFGDSLDGVHRTGDGRLIFTNDIVFSSYWLLTGAREPYYPRDAHDLMHLGGHSPGASGVLTRPPVSLYGAELRRHFEALGCAPLPIPWSSPRGATFVFSHDVDYPQMLKGIECLRLLRRHGRHGLAAMGRVLGGTSHFWTFGEWLAFEAEFEALPAFYFMARQGSLLQYATGTPDVFYDIRRPEFRELFRQLVDAGAEIGMHTSYEAFRRLEQIQYEKRALEEAAGVAVEGNRHHYFHVNPLAPYETLGRHARAGLLYDTSLVFDGYPGFRRGTCHPFRPYHPGERRELDLVEVPPALMDDHFDRRLALNQVVDPEACLQRLLEVARATGGAIVVDYHARGMNRDFYPRYGPWLVEFARRHFNRSMTFLRPRDLARLYVDYERALEARSSDHATDGAPGVTAAGRLTFGPVRPDELRALADMHVEFFGGGAEHGASAGRMGPEFLSQFFYGLNFDNPFLFVDVVRFDGALIGFSACASDWRAVSRWMLRHHARAVWTTLLRFGVRRPVGLARYVLGNLQFLGRRAPRGVDDIPGLFMLLAVRRECRSREFKERTGVSIASELFRRVEDTLRREGCREFWVVLGANNDPVNRLFQRNGATRVGEGRVQGIWSTYYRKSLDPRGERAAGARPPSEPAPLATADAVATLAAHGTLVHESSRSRVVLCRHDGVDLVVKRSVRQESSRWIQLTSLWRAGEGVRTAELLTRLRRSGLPVPEPVAAFDRRRRGLVVESWLVYGHVEGVPCGCGDAPRIAALLRRMHEAGWVHRDPHVRNFLQTSTGLAMIDVGNARARTSRFARAFDVVLLDKCCPGSARFYPGLDARSPWYRLARAASRSLVRWRRLKAWLRSGPRGRT